MKNADVMSVIAKLPSPAKIYAAGRMNFDWKDPSEPPYIRSWRGRIADYTPEEYGVCNNNLSGSDPWPQREIDDGLIYVGPYWVDCGKCCHIESGPHGFGTIKERCLDAINAADFVFAWIEPHAYGTVAEIGYAHAMGKPIIIAGKESDSPEDGQWRDFAFVRSFGSAIIAADNPNEAFDTLIIRACDSRYYSGDATSESPIEKLMFRAFVGLAAADHDHISRAGAPVGWDDGEFRIRGSDWDILPQYQAGKYRLDFALLSEEKKIAVDVDGHAFHERTKEQAQRDKKRDRALQADGWMVIRFTGSEVYANAAKCAAEAIAMAMARK